MVDEPQGIFLGRQTLTMMSLHHSPRARLEYISSLLLVMASMFRANTAKTGKTASSRARWFQPSNYPLTPDSNKSTYSESITPSLPLASNPQCEKRLLPWEYSRISHCLLPLESCHRSHQAKTARRRRFRSTVRSLWLLEAGWLKR